MRTPVLTKIRAALRAVADPKRAPAMQAYMKSTVPYADKRARPFQTLDALPMYEHIEPSLSSKEFFLRKAIGWALREVAWRDPKEVKRYVKAHDGELSGLSKREALKNV